ncbi:MAG: hypothetical protein LUC39_05830 [Clostridiales bacterium]|nr:hypothetical protein [Clostridiales bacterium]
MSDTLYTVIVADVDNILDLADPGTDSARFNDLNREEAENVLRLSLCRGFTAVIWQQDSTETGE